MLIRALFAGVLTISLSATAVASAVLLEIDDVVNEFTAARRAARSIDIPEVDRAEAGDPRTFLILGTDERYADRKLKIKPRSDTILLARVDPDTQADRGHVAPARPEGQDPGRRHGQDQRRLRDRRPAQDGRDDQAPVRGRDRRGLPDQQRRSASPSAASGGRSTTSAASTSTSTAATTTTTRRPRPGEAYATIDVQPGYQKLKGQDALDYVRYRHGDNDFFRASRQQDFLRQITHQDGVRALLDVGKRKELARIFGRYFEVDKSFVKRVEPDRPGQAGLFMAQSARRRSTRSASPPTRPRTRRWTATSTSRTPTLRKTVPTSS